MKSIIVCLLTVILLTGCQLFKKNDEAKALLEKARKEYKEGRYDEAINTIERLRNEHPKAIEERKEALKLFQDASLKQAQQDLSRTDSLLELAKQRYDVLQHELLTGQWLKSDVNKKQEEMTEARRQRDSLQVRFDTQCAKIRYIHRKQKEHEEAGK